MHVPGPISYVDQSPRSPVNETSGSRADSGNGVLKDCCTIMRDQQTSHFPKDEAQVGNLTFYVLLDVLR